MKKSILKSTALVLCAGLVCCLLLTAAIFDAKTTQQTETQLRSLATALGSAYDANGDADAQASQFSRQIGGLRVTVIAKDGTVLGDSAADYKTMENHAGREELKAAEGAGVGISVRPSETLGTRLMYAAVRTQGGEYIRVAMQYNGFLRDLVSLLPALLGAGLVAFAVAAFVATRVAKTVTDPISDFTESLKNVQEGGARLEPEKYPYEELQAMAGDINRMSEEIARNMRRLEREKAKIDYILDNIELSHMVDTSDEWIMSRIGIKTRHILKGEGLGTSYMTERAVKDLLEKTNTDPLDIEMVVCATVTPDMFFPSTANLTCYKTGMKNAFGFDLSAACSGFLFALNTAAKYIETGTFKKVVVIGADKMSSIINYNDRNTCPIFGDGAAAVLLEPSEEGYGVLDAVLHSDGGGGQHLYMKAGGSAYPATHETVENNWHYVYQEGQAVFKAAVSNMADTSVEVMERNKLTPDDITYLVPHQANLRIIDATAHRMGLPREKCMINIDKFGNTTAATIPLCLWDYESRLKKGDNLILAAFGGGYTWGAEYVKWAYDGGDFSK